MSNASDLKRELIFDYVDRQDVVTVDKNPGPESTKNGLMHMGLVMALFNDLAIMQAGDISWFQTLVLNCQVAKGLYARYPAYSNKPKCPDNNSYDDTVGVVAGSVILDSRFHHDVLNLGLSSFFVYNNSNPNKFFNGINPLNWNWWALRLRFPQQILWYFLSCKHLTILSPLLMLSFCANLLLTRSPSYTVLLQYTMISSLASRSNMWKSFRNFWVPRSLLVESATDYFKVTHPIVNLSRLARARKV